MKIETADDTMQLARLLTEALALADTLGLPLAAIHIDRALSDLCENPPVDVVELIATPVPCV